MGGAFPMFLLSGSISSFFFFFFFQFFQFFFFRISSVKFFESSSEINKNWSNIIFRHFFKLI